MAANPADAIDETHRRIIQVIRPVIEQYGFGLAGGNALRAHGLSSRPTRDINMATRTEGAISRALPRVEAALRAAGFDVRPTGTWMSEVVSDAADYTARLVVTAGGKRVLLELGVRDMLSPPAQMKNVGLVLNVEDVLASKTLALADRAAARDFIDVYEAMQQGWSPERLIALAWRLNPGDYDAASFTQVVPNLEELDDFEFSQYGLGPRQVKELRDTFRSRWPTKEH